MRSTTGFKTVVGRSMCIIIALGRGVVSPSVNQCNRMNSFKGICILLLLHDIYHSAASTNHHQVEVIHFVSAHPHHCSRPSLPSETDHSFLSSSALLPT